MSGVVDCLDFLERLGADAALHEVDYSDLEESLAEVDLPPALWKAIFGGTPEALAALLGAGSPVCCLIAPGKPDEEEEEEEEEETPDEEEEQDDEDARAQKLAASSVSRTR